MITSGGTFKIPDQVTVLNKYETKASTHAYQDENERDRTLSLHSGMGASVLVAGFKQKASANAHTTNNGASSYTKHVAERKIDVKLYKVFADPIGVDLNPELYADLEALPVTYSARPNKYMAFLRKWGRFVPTTCSLGGSIIISMEFETESDSQDWSAGVEASLDAVVSPSVAVSAEAGVDTSGKAASLMSNSEISLLANGGDPQVASAITDFTPVNARSTTFRADLLTWLKTVPLYPRMVERIPKLKPVSTIFPIKSKNFVPPNEITLGLIWHETEVEPDDVEIEHLPLATALAAGTLRFTKAQWGGMGISDLTTSNYVKTGSEENGFRYFKPLPSASWSQEDRTFLSEQAEKDDRFKWTLKRRAMDQAIQV